MMTKSVAFCESPLEDVVFFQEGPGIRNSQNTDVGVKFLNIRCFVDGFLDTKSMKHVSELDAFGRYKHFLLDEGDFVVSSSGTLGRIAEVRAQDLPCMLNTSTIRFRPLDTKLLDRLYLRYFLESNLFQDQIQQLATGSVQLNYGPSHLKQVIISYPEIAVQRGISRILGELDSKIQINKKISKNLEMIAQSIFKSWFVDFDPVHAKARGEQPVGMDTQTAALFPDSFEDSELGPIPSGWKLGSISELGRIATGKTPSTKVEDYWNGDVPFVTIPDLHKGSLVIETARCLTNKGTESQKSQNIPSGSTMVSCIATAGLVGFAVNSCQTNQQINSIIPKDFDFREWVFNCMLNLRPVLKNESSIGTVFPNLSKSGFSQIRIILPNERLMLAYSELVRPFIELATQREMETQSLIALRETLLPRLISGELEIPAELLEA